MIEEIDDIEQDDFEAELALKRHTEMMGVFGKLLSALNKPNQSMDLQPFINQNKDLINGFISKINELSKPQNAPNVNVQVNQEKVITSLENISKDIKSSLDKNTEALNEYIRVITTPKEIVAKITKRNFGGLAEEVTFKTTSKP